VRNLLLVPLFGVLLAAALPAAAQDGLKLPVRPFVGIDPTYAGGWLSPERDRLGFAPYHWRDSAGFAPNQRMQWSYAFGARSSLGMSVANGRDFITEPVYGAETRQYGLVGRYSLAPDWSLSAETIARDPSTLFRLQDLRFGLRRQF
jgi:hypothetical protein